MEKSELCTREYSDLNELTSSYNSTLTSLLDKHAPMKEKVVVCRQRLPWFNSEIKCAIRTRLKAEDKIPAGLSRFQRHDNCKDPGVSVRSMKVSTNQWHNYGSVHLAIFDNLWGFEIVSGLKGAVSRNSAKSGY